MLIEPRRPAVHFGLRYVADFESAPRPEQIRTTARVAHLLGADTLVVGRARGVDPFVVLGAIAMEFDSLLVLAITTPADRSPAILAKAITALDLVARGRAFLAISPGPPLPPALERAAPEELGEGVKLGEAMEVCRAMLRVEAPSLRGHSIEITQAWNEPRPLEFGPTPLALVVPPRAVNEAGSPEFKELLAISMRFADFCIFETALLHPGSRRRGRALEDAPSDPIASVIATEVETARARAGRLPGEVWLVAAIELGHDEHGAAVDETLARATAWLKAGMDAVLIDVVPGDLVDVESLERLALLAHRR